MTEKSEPRVCEICGGASGAHVSTYLDSPICVDCIAEHEGGRIDTAHLVRLAVVDNDDGSTHECTLAEFMADNAEDTGTCAVVAGLAPGNEAWFGGGAAPMVTVKRIDKGDAA